MESKVPELLLEIIDQADSGYVRDDTVGTAFEDRITCPSIVFVPNTGKMAAPIKDKEGKETGRYKNVNTRYIKGCEEIEVEKQKDMGFEPAEISNVDVIAIKKGRALFKREGDIALFDYLEKSFWNLDAPNRPKNSQAKALFKVSKVNENIAEINESEFLKAKAVTYVQSLITKVGKGYKFNEEKIDNILTILNKFGGETFSEKINVLTREARINPKFFLETVTKLDEIAITEITHALELNVIEFVDNTVKYTKDKKVIANLGNEKLTQDKKIIAIAELLKTPEYAKQLDEFKIKVDIAKEEQFNS